MRTLQRLGWLRTKNVNPSMPRNQNCEPFGARGQIANPSAMGLVFTEKFWCAKMASRRIRFNLIFNGQVRFADSWFSVALGCQRLQVFGRPKNFEPFCDQG